MMWQDIGAALCLLLIFEGMAPFLAPQRWRRSLLQLLEAVNDQQLRVAGFTSMMLGASLLYLVRG